MSSLSETDLRHAISMRPHPFQTHQHSHSRDQSPALRPEIVPIPTSSDNQTATARTGRKDGHTTSYEATTPTEEENDPVVSRHLSDRNQQDVEAQSQTLHTSQSDPYELSSKIKTTQEIEQIKANTSKKRKEDVRSQCGLPIYSAGKGAWQAKKLQSFYESQNENIERLLKPVEAHRQEAKQLEGDTHLKYKIAVYGSFAANIILAALQLYAAISSKSLSLFTTMADALFDPLSNVTLMLSNRATTRVDPRRYPSGKARIETAGNIFFCFLMCAVSLIIIVQAIEEVAEGNHGLLTKDFFLPSIIAVAVAFCTKLALFLYCFALRNIYSQIRILWEDHRNDLIINGFGIATSLMGSYVRWWIDPMGAILLSTLIIFLWMRTAISEFKLLVGVSAETHMLQLITYISMTHSDSILQIDTVRAYHSGPRLIVEVDVVMDPSDSLKFTHDTAEDLQIKLESLPNVERAYVHVDYETDHAPEHFWKKEL